MARIKLTVGALEELTRAARAADELTTRLLTKDDADEGLRQVIQMLREKGYTDEQISEFVEINAGIKIAASTVAVFWKRPGKAHARKKGGAGQKRSESATQPTSGALTEGHSGRVES